MQAYVPTQLVVVEGFTHGGVFAMDLPEVKEVHAQIAQFVDAHLSH